MSDLFAGPDVENDVGTQFYSRGGVQSQQRAISE